MTKLLRDHRWLCCGLCVAAAGVILWWLIQHGSERGHHWTKAGIYGVLLCAGSAVVCWQWGGELQRQAKHPHEPWLWRKDWARGEVTFSTWEPVAVAWTLVLLVGGVGYGLAFLAGGVAKDESGRLSVHWSAWALTAVEAGLLISAVWRTRAWLRQGRRSVLRLGTLPGRVGGKFTAVLNFAHRARAAAGFHATLTCLRVPSNDKSEPVQECTLSPVEALPALAQNAGRDRLELPLTFVIPADASPSDDEYDPATNWVLTVKSHEPADGFEVSFEVPVFR